MVSDPSPARQVPCPGTDTHASGPECLSQWMMEEFDAYTCPEPIIVDSKAQLEYHQGPYI